MTPGEVLAEFAKLPLPQKMRATADVLYEADARYGWVESKWSSISVRVTAVSLEAEDAKAADRERILEELAQASYAADYAPPITWSQCPPWLREKYLDYARALLDRFPHIAEGWPKA